MSNLAPDAAVRAFLLQARNRAEGEMPTYGELADLFGGSNQGQSARLERLADECAARGEPDLTVIVVSRATGRPSRFRRRPWDGEPETETAWRAELARARAFAWPD